LKKLNDLSGTQTHDLPACSIVPQPTTLLRAPYLEGYISKFYKNYFNEKTGFNVYRQAAETEILLQILNFP
jgi:hypothetical protein